MEKPFEVYVKGLLAKRCLTFKEAVKAVRRFPVSTTAQIFKIKKSATVELIYEQGGL